MKNKNCVIVWLYHTELTEELISYLYPIRNYVDIYLGLCADNQKDHFNIITEFNKLTTNLSVSTFINSGADIRPFLKTLSDVKYYDTCFKIHSKMSNWGARRQCPWRQMLIEDLMGSKQIFEKNLKLLKNDHIGMIGALPFIFKKTEYIHTHMIQNIMSAFKEEYQYENIDNKSFIAGTMFGFKPAHLLSVLKKENLDVLSLTLEQEKGKVNEANATYSHSLERIFGYIYSKDMLLTSCAKSNCVPFFSKVIKPYALNLRILNNNLCYIRENCQIFGKILEESEKEIIIKWIHTPLITEKIYRKKDNFILA